MNGIDPHRVRRQDAHRSRQRSGRHWASPHWAAGPHWAGRHWAALLGVLVLAFIGALRPSPAMAADDAFTSWHSTFTVQSSGVVHVSETMVYQFGSSSGRHGIERYLVTREAWGQTNQDAVYTISNISVSSPDAPDMYTTSTVNQGRSAWLLIKVGSVGQTVSSPTATYTLNYDVAGAMRNSSGYDEFYWDVLSGDTPTVSDLQVKVTIPGQVQGAVCYVGAAQSQTPCTSATYSGDSATYTQSAKPAGSIFTIGTKIPTGLVSDNAPHLVNRADAANIAARDAWLGVGALSIIVSPLLGWLWWRRHGVDRRFVDLPPGVVPAPGQPVHEGRSDPRIQIPVAFAPPAIPVAEAGFLIDGVLDTRETTATLVDLAVRGAVQLRSDDGVRVRLVDPSRAVVRHQQVLLDGLFPRQRIGEEADLSEPGAIVPAHVAMLRSVQDEVDRQGWFKRVRHGGFSNLSRRNVMPINGCAMIVGLVFIAPVLLGGVTGSMWVVVPLVPIVITVLIVWAKARRGQRTAVGRALTDQVVGFRTYLATAEAEQLRFEEGEDIFSKYLPWAIIFDLTDRWAKICARLVELGRLSAAPPNWYYGNYSLFNYYMFNNAIATMGTAATPMPPAPSTSGMGFGGGSAFGGGGGFAGGGGGGGGAGGW